ncbi:MAG: cytochrome-c peroxidase [Methylococcaceae bacterium]|nr:cytochrome-c peroxidase [Methylococcaceae bacterium]
MNAVTTINPKESSARLVLSVLLGVAVSSLTAFQPVQAATVLAQPKLPAFCDPNALRAFPEMPGSLKCIPAPQPFTLDDNGNQVAITPSIIKNKAAAIALGKMLFWDSQVGSDGIACASCHFHAGADNRFKNQINPGFRNASGDVADDGQTPIGNVFDFMASDTSPLILDPLLAAAGKGPNYTLKQADFPLRKYQEPENPIEGQALQANRNAEILYDSNDIISSQGVYPSKYIGLSTYRLTKANLLTPPPRTEVCQVKAPTSGPAMPLFNVNGYSVRQVAPRNTPPVINAVYNFRNFWDGRANNVFNGLDPFGLRRFADPASTPADEIYVKDPKGKLTKKRIAIYNASLASQAVGPALSDVEMSCAGKSFAELGKKILTLKPLSNQKVDPTDRVLGPYAKPGLGLQANYTYKLLIQAAFNNNYWDVPDTQKINKYTLMENNFSLFWGLAVQAYESTLVSNNSRFDQAQEDPINGRDKLTDQEKNGMNLFFNQGKCIACHLGPEFTAASVTHVLNAENLPDMDKYIERMIMGDGGIALYDSGFYNIGVRPTKEDLGVGGTDGYGLPLSYTRNAKNHANDPMDFSIEDPYVSSLLPDPFQTDTSLFVSAVGCVNWNPDTSWGFLCGTDPVVSDERDAVDGAFKTPGLRNVELTGPYFHNGGQATLEQVVEFYNRGGDRKDMFPKDPDCGTAQLTVDEFGNTVVASDAVTGLIDDTGYITSDGAGQDSNMSADMAGGKELIDTTCNPWQPAHETLNLSQSDVNDIAAFLKTLTDERVRWERAPFDHPSLTLPNGHVGNESQIRANSATNQAQQQTIELPAVGAAGRGAKGLKPLQSFASQLK